MTTRSLFGPQIGGMRAVQKFFRGFAIIPDRKQRSSRKSPEQPVFIRKLRNRGSEGLFAPRRGEVPPFKPGRKFVMRSPMFERPPWYRVETPFKPGPKVCHQNWAGLGQPVPAGISSLLVIRPRRCRNLQDCTPLYIYRRPVCLQRTTVLYVET